jgi:hypothetical protein
MRDWPGACVERLFASFGPRTGSDFLQSFCKAKWGFPPTWRVLDCGSETLKGKPPLGSACNIGIWTAGAWGFMLAPHMCRFEDDLLLSLLSSSLRLTHMLLAVCRSIKL